jgi:hypothetical protein
VEDEGEEEGEDKGEAEEVIRAMATPAMRRAEVKVNCILMILYRVIEGWFLGGIQLI